MNQMLPETQTRPAVILVETQMGENIGAAARAMANFGLRELRLVAPRDGWPNEKANAMAASARFILDDAYLFDTVEEAVADLALVFATTARERGQMKEVVGPGEAMERIRPHLAGGAKAGILFGRERWGLTSDEVALADAILTLPVDPDHASLNVGQAVIICAYEWARGAGRDIPFTTPENPPARKEDVARLFEHLESELDAANFLKPPEKRPRMVRNLRNIFIRAGLTDQDVRTLRGVVTALVRLGQRN